MEAVSGGLGGGDVEMVSGLVEDEDVGGPERSQGVPWERDGRRKHAREKRRMGEGGSEAMGVWVTPLGGKKHT